MRIIISKHIPFHGFIAFIFLWFIFVRKEYWHKFNEVTYNHEQVHYEQEKELGFIGFFIWYLLEYPMRLLVTLNFHKAYRNMSFEQEANAHESDMDYIKSKRKHYAFLQYLFEWED